MICDLAVIVRDRVIRMVSTLCTKYALIFHQLRKVLVLVSVHSFSSSMSQSLLCLLFFAVVDN